MDPQVKAQIEKAIEENEILLFMKGTRGAPSCGFSARTVEVLESLLPTFSTVDVLAHPEIREGIKEFSSWPTIPQLYVRGKFVGGADIIAEMYESGDLYSLLGISDSQKSPPSISMTEAARSAFLEFLANSDEVVLLDIGRDYHHGLSIGPLPPSAIVSEVSGIKIAMDRLSASRADGLNIDYITTSEGAAFKMNNPGEPPKVKPLSVTALKHKLENSAPLRLIDVRRPDEWEKARIPTAELLDADLHEELMELPLDTMLVFQCHHGHRSQRAAEQFVAQGFREVYNLTGGIDAWSQEVDERVPRY
jgi:monothiol glutaredoxin